MIRLGLLGAAAITPRAVVEAARAVPGVAVTAVAARDPARARAFADRHGVPRVLPDYASLVADDAVDAVYVALPNAWHVAWTAAAASHGKAVLCEKPLLCEEADAARLSGLRGAVVEAMHWRHHPVAARVRALVRGGAIGRVLKVEASFCSPMRREGDIRSQYDLGGGALMDLGCYAISGALELLGADPIVTGSSVALGWPDVDRAARLTLTADGATATIRCAMSGSVRRAWSAWGETGSIRVFGPWAPQRGHAVIVRRGARIHVERFPGESTFVHQLRAFRASVLGEAPIRTGLDDARAVARVIDAAYNRAGLPLRRSLALADR